MRVVDRSFATWIDTINNRVAKKLTYRLSLRRDHVAKDGQCLIYLNVSQGSKRKRISTSLHATPEEWNDNTLSIRGSSQRSVDSNLVLRNIESKCSEILTRYRLMNNPITIETFVKEYLHGIPRVMVMSYMDYWLDNYKSHIQSGTKKKYAADVAMFKLWRPKMIFHEVDNRVADHFRKWSYKRGNSKSTVERRIVTLKEILKCAKKDQIYFPAEVDDIKTKRVPTNRQYLLPEEVQKFEKYILQEFIPEEYRTIAAFFLFGCYTGKRLGEIKQIKKEDLESDTLQMISPKTQQLVTIQQTAKTKNLIKQAPRLFYDTFTDQYVNKVLKTISKTLKINKRVSMHVSRHTFATAWVRKNNNLFHLQKVLGHSSIKTTMQYVHIVENETTAHFEEIGDTLYS